MGAQEKTNGRQQERANGRKTEAVVFDLGNVLIDWDPRHLYRKLFDDEAAMERFLAEICTLEWNRQLDAGRPFADAVGELSAEHPDHADLIEAYQLRWLEMLGGAVPGTLDVLRAVKLRGFPVYALSNWSLEMFGATRERFPFLNEFDGIVISGEVGVGKPEPGIFRHLIERFGLDPAKTVFIDDWDLSVETARRLGFRTIQFRNAAQLAEELRGLGVLARGSTATD